MKKWVLVGSILLLIIIVAVASYILLPKAQAPQQHSSTTQQSISFPKGGETLVKGQTYTLAWNGGPNPTQIFLVDTSLESQGESVSIVDRIYNVSNTGSYTYKVPTALKSGTYLFQIGTTRSNPFQIADSSNAKESFCNPTDLQAGIALGAGAGNIYGTLTLKNVSQNPCTIVGNNKLQAASSAKNVTYNYYTAAGPDTILLSPNQSVYSKVHYPNGPQCQTGTITSTITFSYQVSPTSTVTFVNQDGNAKQNIVTCVGATNMTQVDMWSISTTPQQ